MNQIVQKIFITFIIIITLILGNTQFITSPTEPTINYQSPIIIHEIMADNKTSLVDEDGDNSDWIELYNRSPQAINLDGWALTDDPQQPDKWLFPDVILQSGGYVLVFASGKDRHSNPLHTNFKLNRHGEFLALYNSSSRKFMGSVSLTIPTQYPNVSYGYMSDGNYAYFQVPTPRQANDEISIWYDFVSPVHFSVSHGFYKTSFYLELTTDTPAATIYYTFDGSEPSETHGMTYTKPILIDKTTYIRTVAMRPHFHPSAIQTQTYIFLNDVLHQPAHPPGWPDTWGIYSRDIFFKATETTYLQGYPVPADYEMDTDIVDDPHYYTMLREGLMALPSISIITDPKNYDIHAQPMERGRTWERPISIEWLDPHSPQTGFQVNAGMRIQGGVGRLEYMPKHSFRIFFRGAYSTPKLHYPLFPDSPVQDFETFILRGGVNRSFAGNKDSKPKHTTYTRDQWVRDSQIAMSGVGSHGIFVHLYLNGLYWGLYNLVERPDADFAVSYFGGDKTEWHAHNHDGAISGDSERIFTLGYTMLELEHGGFAIPENYDYVQSELDIVAFIDYIILNWYAGNQDWPAGNWYALQRNPTGKLHFFVWDAEHTWTKGASLYLELFEPSNLIGRLFMALMYNPDFKITFADRIYHLLYHDGVLSEANTLSRWNRLQATLDTAIVAESARWGDSRYDEPITREHWLKAQKRVTEQMIDNGDKLIHLLREAGHYPLIDPPQFNQHGGRITSNFALTMTTNKGDIYYTTDGSDPCLVITGNIQPQAMQYIQPLILTQTTHVKARTFADGVWSALHESTFLLESPFTKIAIIEMMYNPKGGDKYEFIKLKNIGNAPIDMSYAHFEGIDYVFSAGSVLDYGQCWVLVKNAKFFNERYEADFFAIYQGKLSNKGEKITLKDISGNVLSSVRYDDDNGWALSSDGKGDSLVVIQEHGNLNESSNWQASEFMHGSPQTCP